MDPTTLTIFTLLFPALPLLASKFNKNPIIMRREAIIKAYQEGLYHFSSEENIDSIIQSQTMYPSGACSSYGLPKCYFFAGIPSFGDLVLNVTPSEKMVALKVKLPYETLAQFDERDEFDHAVSYTGQLDLSNALMEKCYLILKEKDSKFYFEETTKEIYDDYHLSLSNEKKKWIRHDFAFQINYYKQALLTQANLLKDLFKKFIEETDSGFDLFPFLTKEQLRYQKIQENQDLMENTFSRRSK